MRLTAKDKEHLKAQLLLSVGVDIEPVRPIKTCKCGQEIHMASTHLELKGMHFRVLCSKCKAMIVEGELSKEEKREENMYR